MITIVAFQEELLIYHQIIGLILPSSKAALKGEHESGLRRLGDQA